MNKYVKPVTRDLSDLTPALGLCSSGNEDGGCVATGSSAGGASGCGPGFLAAAPGGACHDGNGAVGSDGDGTCASGTGVFNI
jgi:hypothetical protein